MLFAFWENPTLKFDDVLAYYLFFLSFSFFNFFLVLLLNQMFSEACKDFEWYMDDGKNSSHV